MITRDLMYEQEVSFFSLFECDSAAVVNAEVQTDDPVMPIDAQSVHAETHAIDTAAIDTDAYLADWRVRHAALVKAWTGAYDYLNEVLYDDFNLVIDHDWLERFVNDDDNWQADDDSDND